MVSLVIILAVAVIAVFVISGIVWADEISRPPFIWDTLYIYPFDGYFKEQEGAIR